MMTMMKVGASAQRARRLRELFLCLRTQRRPGLPIDACVDEPATIALLPEDMRLAAREAFARDLFDAVFCHTGESAMVCASHDGSRVAYRVRTSWKQSA